MKHNLVFKPKKIAVTLCLIDLFLIGLYLFMSAEIMLVKVCAAELMPLAVLLWIVFSEKSRKEEKQ